MRKRHFTSRDAAFERFILKCDPEIEAQFYESVQMESWKHASRIKCPVLIIRGEHFRLFLRSAARRMKRMVPDCRLETIKGCGHFIPMEKDSECIEIIKEFMD